MTEQERRASRIQGLRQLVDFVEAHPELPVNLQHYIVYFSTKEELVAAARIGGWKKIYQGDYFILRREFAGAQLDIYTDREKVCTATVTGQRTVEAVPARPEHTEDVIEWVCEHESLLAPA
jgi:hypothetical protein